jgi:hypothetical protein
MYYRSLATLPIAYEFRMKTLAKFAFPQLLFVAACLVSPGLLCAQAPAGPIHPARTDADTNAPPLAAKTPLPRHELWGAWTLNLKKSDDAREKMRRARGGSRNSDPTWGGGVGYPGSGVYGGRSTRDREADRDRLDDLIFPANSLTLAHNDAEIDVTDDQSRKRVLFTDGRKLQKSKNDKYKELAAHWDGSRLVADEKGPNFTKIGRSFQISADGQQLHETLAIDLAGTFVLIRYVYDPAKEEKPATTATKAAPAETKP